MSLVALSATAEPSTWPQWRGPNRDGQVSGPAWPDKLDTNHLRQVWRVELGPSYSGPIVGADRVFTTETKDKKFEIVTAFDRSTGKELWRAQWEGAMSVPFFAKSNGDWVRSTPALDGDRLYVAGMRDVLVCLDARDGKEVWRKDFVKELKTPPAGFRFRLLAAGGRRRRLCSGRRSVRATQQAHRRSRLAHAGGQGRHVGQRVFVAHHCHARRPAAASRADARPAGRREPRRRQGALEPADRSLPRHEHPDAGRSQRHAVHQQLTAARRSDSKSRRRTAVSKSPSPGRTRRRATCPRPWSSTASPTNTSRASG